MVGAQPARGAGEADPSVAGLLPLALSQPREALARGIAVLESAPTPDIASVAHQAVGIVLRDSGRLDEALVHLRAAGAAARRSGDRGREGDVLASLGVTLVEAGRARAGLRSLGVALELTSGPAAARVLLRRAHSLLLLGRPAEALADLRVALPRTREARDRLWEARCLVNRGWARGALGDIAGAAADAEAARQLFEQIGQAHEAALAVHNLAGARWAQGDLPAALRLLDDAEARFTAIGVHFPELDDQRCRVLLTAGLAPEALAAGRAALAHDDVTPVIRSELTLRTAGAALQTGDATLAMHLADSAYAAFRAQRRPVWAARAGWLRWQTREAILRTGTAQPNTVPHTVTPADLAAVRRLARRLDAHGAPEAAAAHLEAGRLARALQRPAVAHAELAVAAVAPRGRPAPLVRAAAALARARVAEMHGRPGSVLRECRRGLDALDEHRLTLGDAELRALATSHGRELADTALTWALAHRSARGLLTWSERVRASALAVAPVRPPRDAPLAAALAAARDADRRARETDDPAQAARLSRERDGHEAEVRRRYRQLTGSGVQTPHLDPAALATALGSADLVSLVDVGGRLFALRVHAGRVTRHEVGPTARAVREAEFARFALRRAAYGRVGDLAAVGARLEAATLGPLAARLPERLVLVPPALLHTAPWSLVPALARSTVMVAPSARAWVAAAARRVPRSGRVALVTGPGLATVEAEATRLAARHDAPVVLGGATATARATARVLDGAWLAHVAAHGAFRGDAPLFSAVQLADGPLFLHDLQRLRRPPHTLVLSACDVGTTAAVGVDEGLGLVTSLLGLGAAAVLASVVPVDDHATVGVMDVLHGALAGGASLAEAARASRIASRSDPQAYAAAVAFTAWGA